MFQHYPTRFEDDPNPTLVAAIKGALKLVVLWIERDLIEQGDIEPIASAFRDMVSTREKATGFKNRIGLIVDGYDNDPWELWQIPAARQFFRRLFLDCPFILLLAHRDGGMLGLLNNCWVYGDNLTNEIAFDRKGEFLRIAFNGLNEVVHRLALSDELNRELAKMAQELLFMNDPP